RRRRRGPHLRGDLDHRRRERHLARRQPGRSVQAAGHDGHQRVLRRPRSPDRVRNPVDGGHARVLRVAAARTAAQIPEPAMSLTERYGLTLSTPSAAAARHYQDGMDRLLSYGFGADQAFTAAVAADEGFALAHAGAALFSLFQGDSVSAKAA